MFVTEHFLSGIVDKHSRQPVSTDGGTWYPPQACRFLKLDHHLHSFVYTSEKSIIERTMQYVKDRTKECFYEYFSCRQKKCKLKHVINWLDLFAVFPNKELCIK